MLSVGHVMSLREIQAGIDTVVILVGTNPVPCVVSALALAGEQDHVCLCRTKDKIVRTRATNIHRFLRKDDWYLGNQLSYCDIDHARPDLIAGPLVDHLKALTPGGVNVCYTGGTKAMAVHAVRAVADAFPDVPLVFSYIDSHRNSLQVTFGGAHERAGDTRAVSLLPERLPPDEKDLLTIDLQDTLDLHTWKLKSYWEHPVFPRAALALLDLYATGDLDIRRAWAGWANRYKGTRHGTKSDAARRELEQKAKKRVEMPDDDRFQGFVDAWRADIDELFGALRDGWTLSDLADIAPDPSHSDENPGLPVRLDYLRHWLSGGWLESAVMELLCQLRDDERSKVTGALMGVRTAGAIGGPFKPPELDCLTVAGYRMGHFSCTTNDADPERPGKFREAKLKLFEAIARGRQLGGDETQIALVCPASPETAKWLERELNEDFGAGRLARVFHAGDMANLKDEMRAWFQNA